jgi:hypothetical protein
MVDILTQKFTYAMITPFRDYCRISEDKKLKSQFNDSLDLLDEEDIDLFSLKSLARELKKETSGKIFTLPQKKKRKVNYFTTNDSVQERIVFNYLYRDHKNGHVFETTDDRHIKNHYGKPFSEIVILTLERSIRLHGDKLTIKLYVQTKTRGFNCIYFKKRYDVQSLTINLKTGNFTTSIIAKTGKSSSKQFRTNSFRMLKMIITGRSFFEPKNYVNTNSRVFGEFKKVFDDNDFSTKIQKSLGIISHVSYSSNPEVFLSDYIEKFVELKKIKVPNGDVLFWISNFYPTEKFLKKNDRKLIASILDMFGIKSKYTIKILHEYPNLDLFGLFKFCSYFGRDYTKYISNLSPVVFENSFYRKDKNVDFNNNKFQIIHSVKKSYHLSDVEKENLVKIANSQNYRSDGILSERFIQLFDDHFDMIEKIREYDPEIHMRARTFDEFHFEHTDLSKIITAINKGWVIEYKFSEKMVEDIEKPIPLKVNLGTESEPIYGEDLNVSFYPRILKREEEYVEEGKFMHHCVASYADKDKSIIVSLRTQDSMDRVTCEFDCQSGQLIQARHFCNKQPPADMEYVITEDLSKKVKKYARLGLLHASEKLKVPVKINGVEVQKKEPTRFGDDLFLHF